MTVQEIREAAKVMEAYANGKKIQYLNDDNEWIDAPNPLFDWNNCVYRIKPEPKCRPFRTQEECWEEMHNHPDLGWVRNKATGSVAIIGNISTNTKGEALIIWATNQEYHYAMLDVFNDYTFTDGTPFGVKEE